MNTPAGTKYGPLIWLKGEHLHVLRNKGKKKGTRFCTKPETHAPKNPHTGPRNKRRAKHWRETKSDKDLNARMQAWAAAKRSKKTPTPRKEWIETRSDKNLNTRMQAWAAARRSKKSTDATRKLLRRAGKRK